MSEGEYNDVVLPLIPCLRRWTRGYPVDADDLTQATLERAWKMRGTFRPGGNVRAWLWVIMRNVAINVLRRRKRAGEVMHAYRAETSRSAPPPSDPVDPRIPQALATLSPDFRNVLEMVDLRGHTYSDTAQRLGVPVGTVMSRLHRARRLLREPLRSVARDHGVSR